jgi:hypothetical protein
MTFAAGMLRSLSITLLIALAIGGQIRCAKAAAALSDEQVHKLLMLALDSIGRGLCENNKPCAPATAQESANPPITMDEARIVIHRGAVSAVAEQCGLDWQGRNFSPMMRYWRPKMKKSERQMALIGMLHGIMQGMVTSQAKVECTAQVRQNVERQLTFQP